MYSRLLRSGGSSPLVTCRCSVLDSMPASPSFWAAREVGAKSFHAVPLALGRVADRRERGRLPRAGDAFECHDLVAARQDLIDRRALRLVQMGIVVRDVLADVKTPEGRMHVLA